MPLHQKAYLRRSLELHPDRGGSSEKFVVLSASHELLADEKRRAIYDETGECAAEDSAEFVRWEQYWRAMFPQVTLDAIETFRASYQESDEERRDVIAAYVACEGDMKLVVDQIMLAEEGDIGRFVHDFVLPAIAGGECQRFAALKAFEKRKKIKTTAKKKASSAGAPLKANENTNNLALAIQAKKKASMDDLIKKMEQKHGAKRGNEDLPDDAEFEAIQKRMEERRKAKKR